MIEAQMYNKDFFEGHQDGSYSSALKVLPIVNDVFKPNSVIDVGCGIGQWLKVWREVIGVKDIMGVEGDYVSGLNLKIPKELVHLHDLKAPVDIKRKFDLVMSLEVAEHLPESSANQFIKSLVSLGDIILFSASMIGQEGTYHINEQRPEYWAKIFKSYGYVPVDYIRPLIWENPSVEWWYQQNTFLYIKEALITSYPSIKSAYEATNPNSLLRIHPNIYMHKHTFIERTKSWKGFIHWKLYLLKKKIFSKKS